MAIHIYNISQAHTIHGKSSSDPSTRFSLMAIMSSTSLFGKLRGIAQSKRKRYNWAFIFVSFIIGLPFTAFGTYVIFQLQQIGFVIGHGVDSPICELSCVVPFGTGDLDLNAVILYLNAMGFGIAGFLVIFIAALGDYWRECLSNIISRRFRWTRELTIVLQAENR